MTTTTTTYPRLPELAPQAPGETAEAYGLRALLFVTTHQLTVTVDLDGLQLAAHCFRLAVANPTLTSTGAERLAEVGRLISGALARRQADQAAPQAVQAPAGGAGQDRPNLGPGAPLSPAPRPQAPPSAARKAKPAKPAPVPVQVLRLAPQAAPLGAEDLF